MLRAFYTDTFKRDFARLPPELQSHAEKQIRLLLEDRTYPSLRLKKLKGRKDLWEVRVTKGFRIFLTFEENLAVLYRVGAHDLQKRL